VRGGGPYLHPGRSALVYSGDTMIGELGEAHPDVTAAFDIDARIYMAELRFDALFALQNRARTYVALPRYPVVQRDLAVLADESVTADSLKAAIEGASAMPAGVLVEQAELFDVFRGGAVPAGKKSMAYSFTLRAEDRTLNEEEITAAVSAILGSLRQAGAALRE
jgi:phenylalanyl-tRNA synthetase beta chain